MSARRWPAATLPLLVAVVLALLGPANAGAAGGGDPATKLGSPPVFAYYYIWFQPSSWERAKRDYPLLGRYSSDERNVMRTHIELAKRAGIDGFIVSWKSTPPLDERLAKLVRIAEDEHFKLMTIYQGLDFERQPLPVDKIASDLDFFRERFADSPAFDVLGGPTVIWSGTWEFSRAEVAAVTRSTDGLQILASEHGPEEYLRLAGLVDGDAYYWSSVNPDTYPGYEEKLRAMSETIHDRDGLWIAPAAPGFDARMIGGETVVPRLGGDMLRRQYTAAVSSSPDAVGLISWNEFSENSHIEPSETYGTSALEVVADLLDGRPPAISFGADSSEPATRGNGYRAFGAIAALVAVIGAGLVAVRRRDRGAPVRRPSSIRS